MKLAKFATQVDQAVLKEIRSHAKEQGIHLSKIVTIALRDYLKNSQLRPAFRSAMDEVMDDHSELLKRLAQ